MLVHSRTGRSGNSVHFRSNLVGGQVLLVTKMNGVVTPWSRGCHFSSALALLANVLPEHV